MKKEKNASEMMVEIKKMNFVIKKYTSLQIVYCFSYFK